MATEQRHQLKLIGQEAPSWRGIPADELSLGTGGMVYPVANGAGLIAAVLTHAVLMQASRSAVRAKQQAEADKVLEPHRPAIQELTGVELLSQAANHLAPETLERLKSLAIEIQPVFSIAPDERVIILDNKVRWGSDEKSMNERMVRVISPYLSVVEAQAHWTRNSGEKLKIEAALMVAHSVDLSSLPLLADTKPHRTHRYRWGNIEKMERGGLLAQGCDRIVIETLRTWILSAPAPAIAPQDGCMDKPYRMNVSSNTVMVLPTSTPEARAAEVAAPQSSVPAEDPAPGK